MIEHVTIGRNEVAYTTDSRPINKCVKHSGDYIGMRFSHLVVIGYPVNSKGIRKAGAVCRCDCGELYLVDNFGRLLNGERHQCVRCGRKLISEAMKRRWVEHPPEKKAPSNPYHDERLYKVWMGMKTRCGRYGTYKDVSVCDEWLHYPTFREWAYSHGYDENAPRGVCTIDRINPFGDYEPSNCRWVDMHVQGQNKRKSWLRMSEYEREEALAQAGTN